MVVLREEEDMGMGSLRAAGAWGALAGESSAVLLLIRRYVNTTEDLDHLLPTGTTSRSLCAPTLLRRAQALQAGRARPVYPGMEPDDLRVHLEDIGTLQARALVEFTAREFGRVGTRFAYRFAVTAVRRGQGWLVGQVERIHKRRLDSRVLYAAGEAQGGGTTQIDNTSADAL